MKKFAIVTRDYKGRYENLGQVKGMMLHGAEDEIETRSDGFAMCFVDGKTNISPQKLYDVWLELFNDDVDGYEAVDQVFTKVRKK